MATDTRIPSFMRKLEQELEDEARFDRLVEQEEEMESRVLDSPWLRLRFANRRSPEIRWLQKALNRVSGSGIVGDATTPAAIRRVLQKFQAENGLRPTGKLEKKTRALLVELSGIHPPASRTAEHETESGDAEGGGLTDRCPIDSPKVIRGFARYRDDLQSIPPNQQAKLTTLANGIIGSYSGAPSVLPITQVVVVGYADDDLARERSDPGFLQYLSEKRADAVLENLACRITAANQGKVIGIKWSAVGRGSLNLAVKGARTEAERQCNRRAEVLLLSSAPSPRLEEHQQLEFTADHSTFLDYYHIALQGTSGQFSAPHAAEKQAREIADKVPLFLRQHLQKKRTSSPGCPDPQENFLPFFKDAIQGTASKFSNADEAIQKAAEIAEATCFGMLSEFRKLEWKYATLPQPISPDCEIVRGKVAGPSNHVLCRTHDHVIDASAKTVIAHDLDEYQVAFRK